MENWKVELTGVRKLVDMKSQRAIIHGFTQSTRPVEYTDCISAGE